MVMDVDGGGVGVSVGVLRIWILGCHIHPLAICNMQLNSLPCTVYVLHALRSAHYIQYIDSEMSKCKMSKMSKMRRVSHRVWSRYSRSSSEVQHYTLYGELVHDDQQDRGGN